MTKIVCYGIKNCDTMKKTFAWFETRGIAYEFVDYKKAGIAAQHLPGWIAQAGWETLLNRRGLMWKKLSEAERTDVDAGKALQLMTACPSLIKRPVLAVGDTLLVGFDPQALARALPGVSA